MADKTTENLLIFGGIGLAAWWVYETYFVTDGASAAGTLPAGVPSTATAYNSTGGGTQESPEQGDTYTNSSGQVVAIYQGGAWVSPACLSALASVVAWMKTGGVYPCAVSQTPISPTPSVSAPSDPAPVTSCPAGYTLTGGACIPIPVSVPLNYSDTLRSAIAAGAGQATVQAEGSVLTPDRTPARSVNPNAALSGLGALVRMYGSR